MNVSEMPCLVSGGTPNLNSISHMTVSTTAKYLSVLSSLCFLLRLYQVSLLSAKQLFVGWLGRCVKVNKTKHCSYLLWSL